MIFSVWHYIPQNETSVLKRPTHTKHFRLKRVGIPELELSMPVEIEENLVMQNTPRSEAFEFPTELHKARVLVLEEDAMSNMILQHVLQQNFISFQLCRSLDEAKANLLKHSFNLIVSGMNGLLGDTELETIAGLPVPAIALGISSDRNEIQACLKAGFKCVLTKPFSEDDLIRSIYTYMKKTDTPNNELNGEGPETVSLEQLQRIGKNDKEFVLKMLEKFVVSVNECSAHMDEAIANADWIKMKAAAHKSIPSYSLMGLEDILSDLEFIESHAGLEAYGNRVIDVGRSVIERNRSILRDTEKHIIAYKK